MTTKVTVEVPDHANYRVAIATNTPPLRGNAVTYLTAGERTEIYIHSSLRIVSIQELPLEAANGGLAESEVFKNPAPHSDMQVKP